LPGLTCIGVDQAIHNAPEMKVVVEVLGDLVHFSLYTLLFWRDEVEAWVTGSDVVDDFGFHCVCLLSLVC
jgi:hypothetical protein